MKIIFKKILKHFSYDRFFPALNIISKFFFSFFFLCSMRFYAFFKSYWLRGFIPPPPSCMFVFPYKSPKKSQFQILVVGCVFGLAPKELILHPSFFQKAELFNCVKLNIKLRLCKDKSIYPQVYFIIKVIPIENKDPFAHEHVSSFGRKLNQNLTLMDYFNIRYLRKKFSLLKIIAVSNFAFYFS